MESDRRSAGGGLNRRTFLRGGVLAGIGAATLTLATSNAAWADETYTIGGQPYACQDGWWYCVNCFTVFHSSAGGHAGVCPAGGSHVNSSALNMYCMMHDGVAQDIIQVGWRWCSKCQGLFWGPAASASLCPDGGHHVVTAGSYTYDLFFGLIIIMNAPFTTQGLWRYCGNCHGLFYAHSGSDDGVCPKNFDAHQAFNGTSSTNYALIIPG